MMDMVQGVLFSGGHKCMEKKLERKRNEMTAEITEARKQLQEM